MRSNTALPGGPVPRPGRLLGLTLAAGLALVPAVAAPAGAASTVTGGVSGSGTLGGIVVRTEDLAAATPNRALPPRDCTAPCTTTSASGTFSVQADPGAVVSAVRQSDGAGVQLTVPSGAATALPTVPLWTAQPTATTSDGRLQLSWAAPAVAGGTVDGYTVDLLSVGARLGTLTTDKTTVAVDARLVEDASVIAVVRANGTLDGAAVVWQAPFALVATTSRPVPASRGAQCVVTTASGQQARDTLSACGLADGDLTTTAMLPGGANPQRAALDLGSTQAVGMVVVRTSGLVVVQTSPDGTTWTTLDTAVDEDPVTGAYVQRLSTPVQARYVGVVAAAGTSPAPTTSSAPTPPAETSVAPAPRTTSTSATPPPTTSAAPPPTTSSPAPAPTTTTSSAAPLPTLTTTSASPSPTRSSASPTTTTTPPVVPGAQRAGYRAAPAAPAGALPVLQELSVWTGQQGALSGDVPPTPVAVPGVKASQKKASSSAVLPVVGGTVLALLVVGGGAFLVLRRRRGPAAMGS